MILDVNGQFLNVVSFGSGEPAFLGVGGWIGSWQVWRRVLEPLSGTRRVVAYDHRGAGQTRASVEDLHFEGLVDDVLGVLDALGLEKVWLGGESQGGFIALAAALRAPERFHGVTVVASEPGWRLDERRLGFAAALEADYDAVLDRFVDGCIPEADGAPLRRWLRAILAEAEPAAAVQLIRGMRADLGDALVDLALPVQILHGDADVMVPIEGGEALARGIAGAEFHRLPGAGHVPTMTRPAEVHALMQDFAARHVPGPAAGRP